MNQGYDEVSLKRKMAEERAKKGLRETTLETYRLEQEHVEDQFAGRYETRVVAGLFARARRAIQAVLGRGGKPLE